MGAFEFCQLGKKERHKNWMCEIEFPAGGGDGGGGGGNGLLFSLSRVWIVLLNQTFPFSNQRS